MAGQKESRYKMALDSQVVCQDSLPGYFFAEERLVYRGRSLFFEGEKNGKKEDD